MSKKTNWTEIRKAAAQRIHTDEKEMTLFLNALTTAIREGLSQTGNVRINGLGTFSVKAIAPRKSVNIQTGEEITIEGYNKVGFTAEAAMKDVLSHVVIDKEIQPKKEPKNESPIPTDEPESEDPLKKLGEQAGEILSILADLKAMDQEESDKGQGESDKGQGTSDKGKGESDKGQVTSDKGQVTSDKGQVESDKGQVESDKGQVERGKEQEERGKGQVERGKGQVTSDKGQGESDKGQEERGKGRGWLWGSAIVLILALLGIGGYLGWGYLTENGISLSALITGQPKPLVVNSPSEDILINEIVPDSIVKTDTLCPETDTTDVNENTQGEEPVASTQRDYSETLEYATLNKGSRLTLLAERYYGNRDLWVFLYEANQKELPSPHRIAVGTRIRIPKLSSEWTDVNNPTTAAEMARLKEIYEAMR